MCELTWQHASSGGTLDKVQKGHKEKDVTSATTQRWKGPGGIIWKFPNSHFLFAKNTKWIAP